MAKIRCSACRERLQAGASVCRFCNHQFTAEEAKKSRSAERNSTYSKVGIVSTLLLFVWWCSSRPPSTAAEKQQAADLLGMPLVAADRANVKTDQAYFQASTKTKCKERYPADFSMHAACARNAAEGLKDFSKIWNDHRENTQFANALSLCFARYTVNGVTDFSIIGACARNQLDGYAETK